MGLAIGDQAVAFSRRGDVLFGVAIVVGGGNVTVLWQNGQLTEDVPEAYLDVIVGNTTATNLFGRVCRFNAVGVGGDPAPSPEYDALVKRAYTRQRTGDGATSSWLLLSLLNDPNVFVEARQDTVSALTGR